MFKKKININYHLFYETSHSPSLLDIVGEENIKDVIDFCFIANPYYPTKRMLQKLQEKLPVVIKSYPSSNPALSQKRLSKVLRVNPENIVIGNGASELITIIEEDLIENIGIPIPTFSEYIEKLKVESMAKLFQLPANDDYQLNLNDYADWIIANNLSAALIINPGNPTGQFHPKEELIPFLDKLTQLKLIIIDESFIDFAGTPVPSLLSEIEKYPNLLIVRSMSKHCGIPGLRLGYCCSSDQNILKNLRKALPVWNINTLAEYFLEQLAPTDGQYHKTRKRIISDVKFLYENVKEISGFHVYPTGSNFILVRIDCGLTATELQEKLLIEYRVYVRDCSNKTGLNKYHIRIASQGKSKDKHIINALKKVSEELVAVK